MSISADRAQELLAIHADIIKQLNRIDTKYSVNFVDPQIDLPDSLGLTHITFTPKSDDELLQIAEQQALPTYLSRKRQIDASYSTTSNANAKAQSDLSEAHSTKLAGLLADYTDNCDEARRRLRRNGLSFSSLITVELTRLQNKYKQDVSSENTAYIGKKAILDNAKAALDNKYTAQCAALTDEKAALTSQRLQALVEAQNKQAQAVAKYNAALDEREIKYQASCARTREYAREAEYERALEASRLYADLGETGFKAQVYEEKLACCRIKLFNLTQEEAKSVIDADSAVRNHLGSYYNTLVQWIEDTLNA